MSMTVRTLCPLTTFARFKPRAFWGHRFISQAKLDTKSFSDTLLLPKTTFPLWTDPSKSEEPFRQRTTKELYQWQWKNKKDAPLFVLHDGPPYANGNLHMGHALNKIIKDIINRSQLLTGKKVNYMPGWDCHGLPIENKALQELGKDARSLDPDTMRQAAKATALREIDSQREQFWSLGIMADWDTKESTYRTLDHDYEMRQLRIFQKMVERGLIYRHYRPVHFSPSSRSALAEAELVYKDDHVSHSVFVTFDLDKEAEVSSDQLRDVIATTEPIKLLVWTTTPWTLTANMGIAVHQELDYVVVRSTTVSGLLVVAKERLEALGEVIGEVEVVKHLKGSDLVNATYKPIFDSDKRKLPVIAASHVTSESGTGLVHCAPAHGAEDYHSFRSLGLLSSSESMVCHVDGEGKFNGEVAHVVGPAMAESVQGKEVLGDGSKAIVNLLKQMERLVKIKRIKHRYPYDWKTDKPIIVTATSQWFANLDEIKDNALEALQEVSFYPPQSRNRLESFVRSRSEWCISRQRVWGVPIPALHNIQNDKALLDNTTLTHILKVLEEKGVAYWWTGPIEDFIPPSILTQIDPSVPVNQVWRKGTDTMDVWFDSGTSWSMLKELGLEAQGQEVNDQEGGGKKREFLAEVSLEGSDQHRGWFQSQLLTKMGVADKGDKNVKSPYRDLITHGMVLDEKGKKMSKSLGNIVSPMTIIHGGSNKKKEPAYGADVLRLWVATVEYWRDMAIGPKVLSQAAESMRKIRNSTRFMLGNLGDGVMLKDLERVPREQLGLAERFIMHELYTLQETALEGYATYNFPKVMSALGHFANITLSSLYFDITKDCLYANSLTSFERRSIVTVLEQILNTMTAIYGPILPHLAEEVHNIRQPDGTSFFMKEWKPLSAEWKDPEASKDMQTLLGIRNVVLSLLEKARGDKRVKSSLEAEVDIIIPDEFSEALTSLLSSQESFLKTLFITSDVQVTDEGSLGTQSPEWIYTDTLDLPGIEDELAIRIRPATLQKCPRCWTFTREENDDLCGRCKDVVFI